MSTRTEPVFTTVNKTSRFTSRFELVLRPASRRIVWPLAPNPASSNVAPIQFHAKISIVIREPSIITLPLTATTYL
ncbi:hypothetical protein E4U11_006421 [Claviceps purpurea]|nr:hypothetical protein E4U37_007097 [Claviceps purpurea]KAG6154597.1 hypothetical protein E4U11_006421 [Claviceps purpurea]